MRIKYRHCLEQCITCYEGWYCYQCKIALDNFNKAQHHISTHAPVSIQLSDFLTKIQLTNKQSEKLIYQSIVIRETEQDYFCVRCQSSISSLQAVFQHLKKKHYKCTNSISEHSTNNQQKSNNNINNKQSNTSINNPKEHITNLNIKMKSISENKILKDTLLRDTSNSSMQIANKSIANVPYTLMQDAKLYKHFLMQHTIHYGQWYCHLCKSMLQSLTDVTCHLQEFHPNSSTQISDFVNKSIELSDMNCREPLNHEMEMQDVSQDYFCIPCQCSLSSLDHFYEHSLEEEHKRMIQYNEKYYNKNKTNANIVLEEPIDKPNLNDTIDNQNITSVDVQDENGLTRNLPSNIKVEKENTILFKSYNKDNISNVLSIERYIQMAFCCLCDEFIYRTSIRNHTTDQNHRFAVCILNIYKWETSCIIQLNDKKKTFKLQSNSKKFDKMIPETAAKYICDQCNKMIEQDDVINHEITIHKSDMLFAIQRFIYNWSPTSKDLDVTIHYPLFKCSFCNEIIHGILLLEAHVSKHEHEENIKSLIDIKRHEYDNCKNMQIYLEPVEFLNLISFENNGETVHIREQPVIYIKNHYITLCENAVKKQTFTYVCFDCNYTCNKIDEVIKHLCNMLKHLKHFQDIFLTYECIYNMFTSRKFNVNKNEVKSPISEEDLSIDNKLLKECNIDETQINTGQYHNNLVAKMNNTNDKLCENEEKGFFISLDTFAEINTLIKNVNVPTKPKKMSINLSKTSALDRYNKMYGKDLLDFEEIMFACNERKLKEIKLNLQFFLLCSDDKMLCLMCNSLQLYDVQTIYEHINSEKHIMRLNNLRQNKKHFKLLKELVKIESTYVKCYACDKKYKTFQNGRYIMDCENHLRCSSHKKYRKRLFDQVECILKDFQNLWYSIQHFACVNCNTKFKMKIKFMEHLNTKHETVLKNKDNSMFDFCLTCATLWYKNEEHAENICLNYQNHCQTQMHQYLKKSNDFAVMPLPQPMQKLLENVNKIVNNLYKLSKNALNDPKVIRLMDALKHIFRTHQLPVELYMFGSRVTGLALMNSDIDVYVNFGNECTEPKSIKSRSKQIQDCLHTDRENWDIELTLDRSRTPIIKVKHRLTGLQCDISFTKGLSVENSKLIRSFNTAYPLCQKLILFLKKWLSLAGLCGPDGITNYALVWLVIFYLQVEFKKKVPSIAALIKSHNQSKIISGWETGVSDTVLINVPQQSIHELLLGFFEYYGRVFDYMRLVICPLLGEPCEKKSFAEVSTLPDSMALYVAQLHNKKPEYFRIDSPMCVQDPFELSHNLTKAVPILTLKRFKHYCTESLSVLRSVILGSKNI